MHYPRPMIVVDARPSPPARPPATPAALRTRIGVVVASHPVLDAYAGYVPPILGLLQLRCGLTARQAALLLAIAPLVSGLSQPLCAAIADRSDSRRLGAIGLALAAVAMSAIGLASSFASLVALFAIGLFGVGAYHPVAAAAAGELAAARRSQVVTIFFVAGMLGATAGPYISSRLTALGSAGFTWLAWTMLPGLACAFVLHRATRHVPHRAQHHARAEPADMRRRWRAVLVLFSGNAMRYSINIGMLYVLVRWAEHVVVRDGLATSREAIATSGALYAGGLTACMMFGMGVGGLVAGLRVRSGVERRSFIVLPLLLAPAIALFPHTGRGAGYLLAGATGIGYGALIPVSIAMAQRLLPHRTSLGSSLVMGGAWCLAALAPPTMQWVNTTWGLEACFLGLAGLLALSGLVGLGLPDTRTLSRP